MLYKVVDNALPEEGFEEIKKLMLWNKDFPWYATDQVTFGEQGTKDGRVSNSYYLTHLFYYVGRPVSLTTLNLSTFLPVLKPLVDFLEPKSIVRIKGNFYPSTHNLLENDRHHDFSFSHNGAILYLNTCDGYTKLADGTKIDSVENRVVLFDPSEYHNSTTCTNQKGRFNINVNFF